MGRPGSAEMLKILSRPSRARKELAFIPARQKKRLDGANESLLSGRSLRRWGFRGSFVGRHFHVDDDALHGDGLIRDVDNLAALLVVLVVDALGVPPVQVLDGAAVGAVVLEDFGGGEGAAADVDIEVGVPRRSVADDRCRGQPLAARSHLAADRRVDEHLAAVGRDDVEVLDGAGLVVREQTVAHVALFGREPVRAGLDLDVGLADARSRNRLPIGIAPVIAGRHQKRHDEQEEPGIRSRILHVVLLDPAGQAST